MKKVIIIEDDSDIREMYALLFRNSQFKVDETADGESIRLLSENKYDVILLDLVFPNQDGLEIIRKIRQQGSINAETPIVILTNLDRNEKVKKAMELGADMVLLKAHYTPRQVFKEVSGFLKDLD